MKSIHQNWTAHGDVRPEIDWTPEGEPFRTGGKEHYVIIFDRRGWSWEVVLEPVRERDKTRHVVRTLTVRGLRGNEVTQSVLRATPLDQITEVAVNYWTAFDEFLGEGHASRMAHILASRGPGEVRLKRDPPDPEDFAAEWKSKSDKNPLRGQMATRREVLADTYGVTVFAIDKWVRQARDLGLIPSARVGRPRDNPDKKPNETGERE